MHAAMLVPNGSSAPNYFGTSVSLSGTTGLIGAYYDSITGTANAGAAYLYTDLGSATGTVFQNSRLNSATPTATEFFGVSTALVGSTAIVGTSYTNTNRGSVYVFRNLTNTGVQTQTTALSLTGAAINTNFGRSVSLSGNTGLVGAPGNTASGNAAYLYRGLDTATGNPNPTAKLTGSDAAATAGLGTAVSISGSNGLVGANNATKAYFYRNLDTANGTITESAALTSNAGSNSGFGRAVSLDGGTGLVGASASDAVYLYRDLDTNQSAQISNVARLIASDDNGTIALGTSVAVSGPNGIAGAQQKSSNAGAAYIYTDLDTASGNSVLETVRIAPFAPAANNYFGSSVAIDGDNFIVGARGNTTNIGGKAYTGSVSSMTTLNAGSASRTVDQIAFTSRTNWVVGKTTNGNSVTVTSNGAGTISSGNNVYVGQQAGANNNKLTIDGSLTASAVYVGSELGNSGNSFVIGSASTIQVSLIYLAPNNVFSIQGDYSDPTALFGYLGTKGITLNTYGTQWNAVNAGNYSDSVTIGFAGGYTNIIAAVPEPSAIALAGAGIAALVALRRRRRE